MDPLQHSIYHVQKAAVSEKKEEESGLSFADLHAYWMRERLAVRRRNLWLAGITLFSFVSILGLTLFYYRQLDRVRRGALAFTPSQVVDAERGVFSLDSQSMLLLEELPRSPLKTGENLPLTPAALKLAAYHLVLAEKAVAQERYDDALEGYQTVTRIFPDIRGVYGHIGWLAIQLKQYAVAAEAFEKAIMESGPSALLLNSLGVAYLQMQEFERAEAAFRKAIEADPNYSLAYFNLASLFLRLQQRERAAEFFENYLQLKPDDARVAQEYGLLLLQLQKWDRAAELLQQVARRAPDVPPIYFGLAQALAQLGDYDGAINALQRATSLLDSRRALVWLARPEFNLIREHPGFRDLIASLEARE